MNYALHNQELGHRQENKEPVIFMKPDSAILKDGKPFFLPDFSNEVHYETEWWCASAAWASTSRRALRTGITMR